MSNRRGRRFADSRLAMTLVITLCEVMGGIAVADPADQSREDRLRAGYLLNFAKFVEWPSIPAAQPLTVCFQGGSGVRAAFDTNSSGRTIGNHPLVTREVRNRNDASGCSMIYIEASVSGSGDYAGKTMPAAALTVGDAPDFLARGGIIEMFTQDNHLRFNISLLNAQRASLRIGSDLLQLAVRVESTDR